MTGRADSSGLDLVLLVRPPAQNAVARFRFRHRHRHRRDAFVMGRLVAGGIGVARVSCQSQRLASASAPIDLAAVARTAGFWHPIGAAERLEGGVRVPDVAERMIAHVPEIEAWDRLGRVARERLAGRRHIDGDPTPTAGARLRIARVIIGDHQVDDQFALKALARRLYDGGDGFVAARIPTQEDSRGKSGS
jgi:hypothetical protein